MSATKQKEMPSRPFPWLCADCVTRTVVPSVIDYTAKVKHDGVIYELPLPKTEVPRCQTCGNLVVTTEVDERVNDALRSRLRLLPPREIRRKMEALGLNQQQFAELMGVAKETISRWVTGALIQSRAMDNLLRLCFESEDARRLLRRKFEPEPAAPVNRIKTTNSTDCDTAKTFTRVEDQERKFCLHWN
jgi:putative zinc finger/helix-turn-helix YgiT family protein